MFLRPLIKKVTLDILSKAKIFDESTYSLNQDHLVKSVIKTILRASVNACETILF